MNNINIIKSGNVFGVLWVAIFGLCMAWGLVLLDPVLKELHLNILRIVYPGFSMSFVGIVIGVVESFIYGWLIGVLFAWLCRKVCICD